MFAVTADRGNRDASACAQELLDCTQRFAIHRHNTQWGGISLVTRSEQGLTVVLVGGRKRYHAVVVFADERFEGVRGSEARVDDAGMRHDHAEDLALYLRGFGSLEEAFDKLAQFVWLAWVPGSSDG